VRERVVLGELPGLGAALRDEVLELLGRRLGDVLVELPRLGAGEQDAPHGRVLEGAIGLGMGERREEVDGVVPLSDRDFGLRGKLMKGEAGSTTTIRSGG